MSARFVLDFKISPEREADVLSAYGAMRTRLEEGVPGLRSHQLCQSTDDPARWIVTSDWDDLESSLAWLRSNEHGELIKPLRACMEGAANQSYQVRDGIG